MTWTQLKSKRTIYIKSSIIIISNITIEVLVIYKSAIPENRDFLFELDYAQDFKPTDEVFAHVVDTIIFMI